MIKNSILKLLSEQVNAEYYSAYLYLGMSAYADRSGFKGIANWLFVQAKEEMAHGTHIYEYILERGAMPTFEDIKMPKLEFSSIESVFAKVLEHEKLVTSLINDIADKAILAKDHATYNFILWYVDEQVEEEAQADDLLTKVKCIGKNTALLYSMDSELASRAFHDPFAK